MADALVAPFLVAAGLLLVAALAKLRSPDGAARALSVLGIGSPKRGRTFAVRVLAITEVLLGGWCLVAPGRLAAALLAAVYAAFTVSTIVLVRRSSACGCFGETERPTTVGHCVVNAVLALVALAAAITSAHGLPWVLGRSPGFVAVFVLGTAGAVYGTVLAYTELPHAWGSWSTR